MSTTRGTSGSGSRVTTDSGPGRTCPACRGELKPGRRPVVWRPPAAEIDKFIVVSVHNHCRQQLIAGWRPPGVVRHGLTPRQAMTIVELCEGLGTGRYDGDGRPVGWTAYHAGGATLRAPFRRELREARVAYARELERVTQGTGSEAHRKGNDHLHSYANLVLAVGYHLRNDYCFIAKPVDLMDTLRDLSQRKKLHELQPPREEVDLDYFIGPRPTMRRPKRSYD